MHCGDCTHRSQRAGECCFVAGISQSRPDWLARNAFPDRARLRLIEVLIVLGSAAWALSRGELARRAHSKRKSGRLPEGVFANRSGSPSALECQRKSQQRIMMMARTPRKICQTRLEEATSAWEALHCRVAEEPTNASVTYLLAVATNGEIAALGEASLITLGGAFAPRKTIHITVDYVRQHLRRQRIGDALTKLLAWGSTLAGAFPAHCALPGRRLAGGHCRLQHPRSR
jgi:hypothetical protein